MVPLGGRTWADENPGRSTLPSVPARGHSGCVFAGLHVDGPWCPVSPEDSVTWKAVGTRSCCLRARTSESLTDGLLPTNTLLAAYGGGQPEVWLLNAAHMKNVPGRKTDVADSAWIAQLVEHGLVRPSFVPPPPIRELRDFTLYRRTLVEERTRAIQRLEKVLQDAGIKISSVASTILTKSGRTILEAMLAGQSDPAVLADMSLGRLRSKIPQLRNALTDPFRVSHHGVLVKQMLAHIDFLEQAIQLIDDEIGTRVSE